MAGYSPLLTIDSGVAPDILCLHDRQAKARTSNRTFLPFDECIYRYAVIASAKWREETSRFRAELSAATRAGRRSAISSSRIPPGAVHSVPWAAGCLLAPFQEVKETTEIVAAILGDLPAGLADRLYDRAVCLVAHVPSSDPTSISGVSIMGVRSAKRTWTEQPSDASISYPKGQRDLGGGEAGRGLYAASLAEVGHLAQGSAAPGRRFR